MLKLSCISGRHYETALSRYLRGVGGYSDALFSLKYSNMDSAPITVHWHEGNQPVYSADFQNPSDGFARLATGGGDNNVRIWRMDIDDRECDALKTSIHYLSTLRKHTQAVNAVRFDPSGYMLASASDDGLLIVWGLSDEIVQDFGVQDDDMKETWKVRKIFHTHSEIYDIAWSPDSNYIAAGSMDNAVRVFNIKTEKKDLEFLDHGHCVQGVAWDPLNKYFATQSADRSLHIYQLKHHELNSTTRLQVGDIQGCLELNICRSDFLRVTDHHSAISPNSGCLLGMNADASNDSVNLTTSVQSPAPSLKAESRTASHNGSSKRTFYLYHSEALQSFFRRLTFSPDGSLLLTVLGLYRKDNKNDEEDVSDALVNTVYIYTRAGFSQLPVCSLSGFTKPTVAIKFSPIIYELDKECSRSIFDLPHKMLFAVATLDTVIVYTTQRIEPLGILKNLHYSTITDLAWSSDGKSIIVSSADGFCSVIRVDHLLLGTPLAT